MNAKGSKPAGELAVFRKILGAIFIAAGGATLALFSFVPIGPKDWQQVMIAPAVAMIGLAMNLFPTGDGR